MATVNFIRYSNQSATALGKVAEYVSQEKKTAGRQLVSGINCSPQFAVQEFKAVRMVYRKDSSVWFYHYTQSFSPDEIVTGQQAHEVAKEFAEKACPDSQILVATHVDTHHIHSHFIVNSVCFESGYMLRQGPRTLEKLRKLSDEICVQHGLSVLPSDPPRHSREPGTREYRSMEKNQSWKMDLILAIENAMALACSREHFIKLLERRGYKVRWTDERRSITYTTPSGMKCRDNKLHEDKFLKEAMEYEFKLRAEIIERIEGTGPSTDAGGTGSRALRYHDRAELGRDDYIFRRHGMDLPMTPSSFTWRFKLILKKHGLPQDLNVHSLRHTAASLMIAGGADVATVSGLLGHSQVSTTLDIYTHAFDDKKKAASVVLQKNLSI